MSDKRTLVLNVGPQHPSTHGVLRIVLELDGEVVVDARPDIGYLHTAIEKTAEHRTFTQAITLFDRADYLAPLSNNLGYVLAVERLLGLEAPPRAQAVRVMLAEITRIASHLVWLGTHAIDLGAMTVFLYAFQQRELALDLFEAVSGARMHQSYFRIGGLRDDLPPGFEAQVERFLSGFPAKLDEMEDLLTKNPIWLERTKGIGTILVEEAVALGLSGPNLRGSGLAWDLRKSNPYSSYESYDFDVPTGQNGDVYDRYLVRLAEMRQSVRIAQQSLSRLPGGPINADAGKIVPPPKELIGRDMESLIHHFLLWTDGFPVPRGEVYQAIESPRGELGFVVISDGGPRPYRVHIRGPSFVNLQALAQMCHGRLIADLVAIIGSLDFVMGEVDR